MSPQFEITSFMGFLKNYSLMIPVPVSTLLVSVELSVSLSASSVTHEAVVSGASSRLPVSAIDGGLLTTLD